MRRLFFISIGFLLFSSCTNPEKELVFDDEVGVHRIALFGDNTCIEAITETDTAYTYAGYWSGGYEVGETLTVSHTRIGFEILAEEIRKEYTVDANGNVSVINQN